MTRKNPLSPDMLKVFETVPDLYLILSTDLHILTASNHYLIAIHRKREEIIGRHFSEVFPDSSEPKAVKNLHASLQKVLATLQPHQMEMQRYDVPLSSSASGGGFEKKYWNPVNTPVLDDHGDVLYIIHKISDATEQLSDQQHIKDLTGRAQAALDEANWQQIRLIDFFMQAPVAIGIFEGRDHIIELVNPLMGEVMGRNADEVLGKPLFKALPELEGQGYEAVLSEVYTTGKAVEFNESPATLQHDVELVKGYYHTVYQPLKNAQGEVIGIINIVIDVSEQVMARQKVGNSEKQLRLITNAVPALIGYLDREEKYRFANQAYESWFNQKPEALLGRPVDEIVGQKAYQGVKKYIDRALAGERLDFVAKMPYREDFVKHIRTSYVPDIQEGEVVGFFTLVSDITEQVESMQEIEKLNKELEERVASRTSELELARTEAEVERSKLYNLFMQAPALICIFRGPEHIFHLVNPLYQQLVGDRPILDKPIREAMPELEGQPIFGLLDEVYRTGESFHAQEMMVQLDHKNEGELGQNFYNFIYQPTRNLAGTIDGILVFAYEVTAQVRARKLVEQSEEKLILLNQELEDRVQERTQELQYAQKEAESQRQILHDLFMQAPAPIVILEGEELVYQLVNPAYQQIFPGRELRGKPLIEALPELKGTSVLGILDKVYKTGETFIAHEFPLLAARHQGAPLEELYFTFTYQARRDHHSNIDGILVFAYEVTDQVVARKKVEEREQYFRMMADNVPVMIWVTRPDGQCTYLNKQWYEYTGQTEAIGLGLGWLQAVHPNDSKAAADIFLNANTKQISFDLTYRLRGTDGKYRWAIDIGIPKFNAGGEYEGFVGAVIDIHERKKAEESLHDLSQQLAATNEELRAANEEIQASNEELSSSNQQLSYINADMDNFIYTASHDLRAPISNIEGLMIALLRNLSQESRESPMTTKLSGMITSSIERFKRTLNDLTQITKVQREGSHEDAAQIDITAVIHEVKLDLTSQIEEAGARFEMDLHQCTLVHFSAKNARSIVYNLLSNAIKYRSPNRQTIIRLQCYPEGEYLIFTVEDNGLGMDLTDKSKIFAMFKRLHDHVEGTGIGLYIVKKIVENAGGKIEVQSKVGEGTTFSVYFKQIFNA